MKFGKSDGRRPTDEENTQRGGNAIENEGNENDKKATEDERTEDTPTWGCARAATVEARVKRAKDVGNEEEDSKGASNDAVAASLRRSVGGHARVGGERKLHS